MKNEELMVSVIIPTYKRSDMLCEAIESVLHQTYPNVEVIVVDDNEPNTEWRKQTAEKMKFFSTDDRVKYICHEINKNGSAARNTGIKEAKGCFFCFLDDDDCYYPEKISEQVSFLLENNVDGCYCDYKKNGVPVCLDENVDIARNILLEKPTPQTSGWMITKKAVDDLNGFDENYYRHQDYEFLLRFLRKGFQIRKVNKILYERKVTSIDNNPSGKKTEEIKKKLFNDFSDFVSYYVQKEKGFREKMYVSSYASSFKNYYKSKDLKNCMRMFVKSCACCLTETFLCYTRIIRSHIK